MLVDEMYDVSAVRSGSKQAAAECRTPPGVSMILIVFLSEIGETLFSETGGRDCRFSSAGRDPLCSCVSSRWIIHRTSDAIAGPQRR